MTQTISFAALFGLASAAVFMSVVASYVAQRTCRSAAAKVRDSRTESEERIGALRRELEALAKEVGELRKRESEPAAHAPLAPRAGLNMTKRSQALRMHRLGETSERIAEALQLSIQEINLLLKVHQIVIGAV